MSFAIVRLQKFHAQAVKGIQSHDLRERPPRTNPDIDHTKTAENYSLHPCEEGFSKAIEARLKMLESKKAIRKDAVVMAQMLVTSDPTFFRDMPLSSQKSFFRQSLDFIADRYGKENILSATVHMDEKTPHMHVNFTPIRGGRLTAKTIFTRAELSSLQSDFHTEVGEAWGLERGQSREEKRRHLDTEAYKVKTRQADLASELAIVTAAEADIEKRKAEIAKKDAELIQAAMTSKPLEKISPADIAPRKEPGFFGKTETAEEVAVRLNKRFITPLASEREHMLALRGHVRTLERRVHTLEVAQSDAEDELKTLHRWRSIFRGITREQWIGLGEQARVLREKNIAEEEKARQDALEREKRAKQEALEQESRRRVEQDFDRELRWTMPGTAAQRIDKRNELMAAWDKAEDKKEFEKAAKEQLREQNQQREHSRGLRMR